MNDQIRDIEFFQEVIIAFTEGASDEKVAAEARKRRKKSALERRQQRFRAHCRH